MRPLLPYFIIILVLICTAINAHSQADSTSTEVPDSLREKEHSPTKDTLMSACLPGLGQLYNRKYWKIPVIYTGFGIMTYFIVTNANEYSKFKNAYVESVNGVTNGSYSDLVQKYTSDELLSSREYYRRNLEVSCILTVVWYALNILDAAVDAHLYTFNISDRLTLKAEPAMIPAGLGYKPAAGVRLSVHIL